MCTLVAGDGRHLRPGRLAVHVDRLISAALSLTGSREDAEDLVQETFARVLQRPRTLRNSDELGYLLRALHNTWVSTHRVHVRRPPAEVLDDEHDVAADTAPDPSHSVDLRAAIATLPDDYRQTLVAVDVLGLTYREAAEALDVCHGTVMSRLFRARRRVVAELDLAA